MSNLKLHDFYDAEILSYAILSHTWTKQEVSLQTLEDPKSKVLAGYTTIKRCCELALSEGWKYAWIDTCRSCLPRGPWYFTVEVGKS